SSTSSATCRSTSTVPICCFRSSASATSARRWSSPPIVPTSTGRRSSTTTARSPPPSSTASSTTSIPSSLRARASAPKPRWAMKADGVTASSVIDSEVGRGDVDVEEIDATGELQRTGLGEGASTRLQDVGDVLGAEGLEREAIGDGAGDAVGGVDLGQRQDLADVVAGVEPLLLEAVVIGLSIRGQCQEAQHQPLLSGSAAPGDQALGVLVILDVLVAGIAARMAGDELGIEVDADAVGVSFDGQSPVRVSGGDGVAVGIEGDAELARGARGCRAGGGVAGLGGRRQMGVLPRGQIDGTPRRLAVDAHVGGCVEPDLGGCLDGIELGELQAPQEVLLDVAYSRLDAALLVAAGDVAGRDGKAVVAGKVGVARVEHRRDAGEALQHGGFKIIDHYFCRDAAKRRERMLVTAEEMLHGLRDGELDVHQSAVGEHDDEEGEPAAGVAYCDRAKLSPVDLRPLPGSEVQFEVDGELRLPDAADVVAQDGDAAAVSFLAQALEDLLRAIGVRIEQPCDAPFERVEEA